MGFQYPAPRTANNEITSNHEVGGINPFDLPSKIY
jgi:hypothetical protein